MARLALGIGGMVLGNMLLPGLGASIGGVLGQFAGGLIDQQLFGNKPKNEVVHGARMQDLRVQSSGYGAVIPRLYGRARLSGNVIWMRGFHEEITTTTQRVGGGGKGGGKKQKVTNVTYTYFVDLAVAVCAGSGVSLGRIFADGNALGAEHYTAARWHGGAADEPPDPLIQAVEGAGRTPAYRGLAYIVFERLAVTPFGNRLPNLTFEVTA